MAGRSHSPPLPPQAVFKHPKLLLAVRPDKVLYVAGQSVNGVLELSCSSEKCWLGRIGLEIRGSENLQSLDHAASQSFLTLDVAFQSPALPPSNAVISTSPSLSGYWPARKGVCRFPFSFPLPATLPSSCRCFSGNASVSYYLLASVQVQYQGERQILTKRLEIQVVERWTDWKEERFHEPSEAQRKERVSAGPLGGLLKGGNSNEANVNNSVWVDASIPDRLFYRGYDLPDGTVERERSRGQLGIRLSVKNCASRTLSGIKLSLHRRLKILPAQSSDNGIGSGKDATRPRITEDVEEQVLHGREYEFPQGGQERQVQLWMDIPKPEKMLSVRKTRLFEVHTLVKVTLEMGALTKDIELELPIWVAHYASLPREAFFPRPALLPSLSPSGASPFLSRSGTVLSPYTRPPSAAPGTPGGGYFPARSPQPGFGGTQQYVQWQGPIPSMDGTFSPNLPPMSPATSPIPYSHPQMQSPQYIAFDPSAPNLTQSKFFAHLGEPNMQPNAWQNAGPSMQRPSSAMSYAGPSSPNMMNFYQQPQPQQIYQSLPQPPFPRSASANPYVQSSPATLRRVLSPALREALTEEEQARVLSNSQPSFYDASQRAHTLQRQQEQQRRADLTGNTTEIHADPRGRRQSMPLPPPSSTLQRSTTFDTQRSAKTPPIAPSSRFMSPPIVSSSPVFSPQLAEATDPMGLETIGEDGESQAGTLRMRTLPRSASQPGLRSVKALHALGSSVDEDGNTSVSLLEEMADKADREREAARLGGSGSKAGNSILAEMEMEKSLPRPPVPSRKEDRIGQGEKPRLVDIFPGLGGGSGASSTVHSESAKEATSSTSPNMPTAGKAIRRTSQPIVSSTLPNKPSLKPSNSDSLLALESRLSRPSSPISPTSPLPEAFRPMTLSPPLRSGTTSPIQRAVSPVHIGNAGALRKKSSQISLKRRNTAEEVAVSRQKMVVSPDLAKKTEEVAETERLSKAEDAKKSAARVRASLDKARDIPKEKDERQKQDTMVEKQKQPVKEREVLKEQAVERVTAWRSEAKAEEPKRREESNIPSRQHETTISKSPPLERLTAQPASTSSAARQRTSSKPALSPVPASPSARARSPTATPNKRYVSDPQSSFTASPALAETTNKQAPCRQSLDQALPMSDEVKYGSARGGRGGLVTDVAKQWANLIAAGDGVNDGKEVIIKPLAKTPRTSASAAMSPPTAHTPHQRTAANPVNIAKAASAPVKVVIKPQQQPLHRFTAMSKATPAKTFTNTTIGKSPVFAKATPVAVHAKRSVSDPVYDEMEASKEQPVGPGATKLKALIEKFS